MKLGVGHTGFDEALNAVCYPATQDGLLFLHPYLFNTEFMQANILHLALSRFLPNVSLHFFLCVDSGVIRWVRNNLSQCVQLSLELSWTSVLHTALSSEDPTKQLKQTR